MTADNPSDVVEFGPAPAAPGRPRVRITTDPRTAISLLVLGAAAAVASLVGEWQSVVLIPRETSDVIPRQAGADVMTAGAFGTGYVLALLALSMLATLALFGHRRIRPHARLAGLGLAAATAALLFATAYRLSRGSGTGGMPFFDPISSYSNSSYSFEVTYTLERGLWAAFAAVALIGAALWVNGSVKPAEPDRAKHTPEPEEPLGGAMELSVSATAPFVR